MGMKRDVNHRESRGFFFRNGELCWTLCVCVFWMFCEGNCCWRFLQEIFMYFNVVLFAKVVFPVKQVHPWKLTWNPKMEFWKMISLFKAGWFSGSSHSFSRVYEVSGSNCLKNFQAFEPKSLAPKFFVCQPNDWIHPPDGVVFLGEGESTWQLRQLPGCSTFFSANFRCELVWRCLVFQILWESNLKMEKTTPETQH